MTARRLSETFLHLGPGKGGAGPTAVPQPPFDGPAWYEGYGARHGDDGADGRLVSQYTFTQGWDSWEMHPKGAEVVICTHGGMILRQEFADGARVQVPLAAGEYAINPPGVWHIADLPGPNGEERATAIFITPGEGTQNRQR